MRLKALVNLCRTAKAGEEFDCADEQAAAILIRDKEAVLVERGARDRGEDTFSLTERAALAIVQKPAHEAIATIAQLEDRDLLRAVGVAEEAGKGRSTVFAAIAERGAALSAPVTPPVTPPAADAEPF